MAENMSGRDSQNGTPNFGKLPHGDGRNFRTPQRLLRQSTLAATGLGLIGPVVKKLF